MAKWLWFAFVGLLLSAHLIDTRGDAVHRPLSMFRDFDQPWIGYLLFGVLLAIGVATIRTAHRAQAVSDARMYTFVMGLLLIVAVTPSWGLIHNLCATAALFVIYFYYIGLLYREDLNLLLMLHLFTPSMMLLASRAASYGLWQKGMVLYFLTATVAHESLLAQWPPTRRRRKKKRGHRKESTAEERIRSGKPRIIPRYNTSVARKRSPAGSGR